MRKLITIWKRRRLERKVKKAMEAAIFRDIFRGALILVLCLGHAFAQTPTANAGSDQTIYLTLTNQVTLTGTATNRSTSTWREVSTDYTSGATITTPSSLTTTVTGLPQGVFYFELAVTSPTDIVAVDTVKIIVNLQAAPGTLLRSLAQNAFTNSSFVAAVNNRSGDTTSTPNSEYYPVTFPDGLGNEVFFDVDRTPDMYIDPQTGKLNLRIEDGYQWNSNGYSRAEFHYGSGYAFDTTKTYCMEWKGYFPQAFPSDMTVNQTVATFMQIHANSDAQHVFGTQIVKTSGGAVNFVLDADGSLHTLCGADSFVNKTHTVRVTFKEGVPAFYKVEVDGVQVYYNNTSIIGGTPRGQDYPKIATLYDYGNALVDPTNSTRHRTVSLVTEDFSIYSVNAPPTISMSGTQNITVSNTSVSASATPASGQTITGYHWTGATFGSPNSSSTTVTGLSNGTTVVTCTATQSDGQTVSGTVTINVAIASAGSSKWIHNPKKFVNTP